MPIRRPRTARARGLAAVLVAASMLLGCSDGDASAPTTTMPTPLTLRPESPTELWGRLEALDAAVTRWRDATDLAAAQAAAEEARNLVVGPDGPSWGDGDGDGATAAGHVEQGLLPGLHGEEGLASPAWTCLDADVLGGSWADPRARWDELAEAIEAWSPTNNPFPTLASHPQRVVGWATLTLATDDLDTALEYAGHARLHVDVTFDAAMQCVPLQLDASSAGRMETEARPEGQPV